MSKFRGFYEFTDIVNSDEELMLTKRTGPQTLSLQNPTNRESKLN